MLAESCQETTPALHQPRLRWHQPARERRTGLLRVSAERQRDTKARLPASNKLRSMSFLPYSPGKQLFRVPSPSVKAGPTLHHRDTFSNLILTHWHKVLPLMIAKYRQEHRKEAALIGAGQQFSDLMWELTAVKKMAYASARERTVQHLRLSEEESSLTNQNQNVSLPATSA